MVLHLVRIIFLLVVLAVTISFAFQHDVIGRGSIYATLYILIPAALAFAVVMIDMLWKRKRLATLSGVFFGLLAGLVIAIMLSLIVDKVVEILPGPDPADRPAEIQIPHDAKAAQVAAIQKKYDNEMTAWRTFVAHERMVQLIKLLMGAAAVFLCVTFVLQTKDVFRFVIPYVEFAKESKGPRPMLLDTSVIIDGRIADIVDTRVLESDLVVPRFILAELQAIADSEDKLRRNRGRRGLDILNRLQSSDKVDIQILDLQIPDVEQARDVDAKLVALAKHLGGRIATNDYNLNKIAQLRGVTVVNINDLANAMKPIVLPGENMSVKIIKPGEESGQGVGYLDDGTMIVAEQGRDFIGREITIIVTSVLQTSAGRMIFGKLDADKSFTKRDRKV